MRPKRVLRQRTVSAYFRRSSPNGEKGAVLKLPFHPTCTTQAHAALQVLVGAFWNIILAILLASRNGRVK
jgi:hypothetical protein